MPTGHAAEIAAWPDVCFGDCDECATVTEHRRRLWWPCEQPERPLDRHGLFEVDGSDPCPACERAWVLLGCPVDLDA